MPARFDLALIALMIPGTAVAQTLPPIDTHYDSQLGGAYQPTAGVGIVSRDRLEPPAPGLYSICYVNAFQTQPGEGEWWLTQHPDLVLQVDDSPLEDPNWPGEYLLDISTQSKREAIAAIVGPWIERCARDGFDAVEADNLDTWTRSHHMLTMDDAIQYAGLLAVRVHANGLAFAQKNAAELGRRGRIAGFDLAITESCAVYDECDDYRGVYGDRVLQIEYDRAVFDEACAERGETDIIVLRDRFLSPAGDADHVFEAC
jgi:hypothetical protein